jgi:DNA/RNA endonuclease YhcR with UshA esterase domain
MLGRHVRVKDTVAEVYHARSSNGQPTFIDLGQAYPSPNRLTVLIWAENRGGFPAPPEKMFRPGTAICVDGTVSSYRGVSQIEVRHWNAKERRLGY